MAGLRKVGVRTQAPSERSLEEEGLRHAFIEVGPHTVLHPFEVPGIELPGPRPMFQRGRLAHFALSVASEEAFWKLRRRLVAPWR